MSRGLSFSPSVHFDLFRTILDINKFGQNIAIRKHSEDFAKKFNYEYDVVSNSGNEHTAGRLISEESVNCNVHCNFQGLVSITHLHGLRAESSRPRTNKVVTKFNTSNPYFYPMQSCTNSLDRFQEYLMRDLADLHHKISLTHNKDNLTRKEHTALREVES